MGTSQEPVVDTATRGDWVGNYGNLGYQVVGGETRTSWPSGWTVETDGTPFWKLLNETDAASGNYLTPIPPDTLGYCACVYRSETLSWTITPPDDSTPYRFALYDCYLEADASIHRTYSIQILDDATDTVLHSLDAAEYAFKYVTFRCTGTVRVTLTGSQPVMTGVFLDAVEDPGGDQYDEVGNAGGAGLPASTSTATSSPAATSGGSGLPIAGPHVATAPASAASGRGYPAATVQVLAHPATAAGGSGYAAAVVASSGTAAEVGKAGGTGRPVATVQVVTAPAVVAGGRGFPAAVVDSTSSAQVLVAAGGSGRPAAVVAVVASPATSARGSGWPASVPSPPTREPIAFKVVALGRGRPAATVQVLAAASVAALGTGTPAAKVREVLDLTANVDPFRVVLVVDPAAVLECDPESVELVQ